MEPILLEDGFYLRRRHGGRPDRARRLARDHCPTSHIRPRVGRHARLSGPSVGHHLHRELDPGDTPVMSGAESPARYPIRAVSKLTGIGIDTLRVWERRYGVVVPARDGRGRLYTDRDVSRLRLVRQAVAAGHTIGRVATLSADALERLTAFDQVASLATPPAGSLDVTSLRAAIERFDSLAADQELSRLATILPPADLVRNVILPVVRDVGEQWNTQRGGIAREHLISATLRHLLGSFLRLHARAGSRVNVLCATPSGDRHELGILAAAMLAASHGLAVCYLGPDVPADDIATAAQVAGTHVVVLGITLTDDSRRRERELRLLLRGLPAHVDLWVGGPGAARYAGLFEARAVVFPDFDAFIARVHEVARRHPI